MRYATCLILVGAVVFGVGCKKDDVLQTHVYNLGVAGNTANDLIKRLGEVINVNPNLVVIMIGTNDAKRNDDNFFSYKKNLVFIVKKIKANRSNVILMKPPPILDDNPRNERLQVICRQIDTVSNENNCYMIDINKIFSDSLAAGRLLISDDGVHPNADGQNLIAKTIFQFLSTNTFKQIRIACFGDSITRGGSAPAGYPDILQALLN